MTQSNLIVEDPMEIIQMLSAVSERVAEYMDTQQYLADNDNIDGIDENTVITDCYLILIEELKEKGIEFYDGLDDILSNYADSERIYHLYEWIDTKYQISLCSVHETLIPLLENIINTEDDEEDIIVQWIKAVQPLIQDTDPHLVYILPIMPYIRTTSDFEDILNYIYTTVVNLQCTFKQPMSVITAYIQTMLTGQNNAKTACTVLQRYDDIVATVGADTMQRLYKHLDKYDVAKTAPECISDYAWAWTIETGYNNAPKKEDLPPSLREQYDQLELDHHTTTDHHIEYYLANQDIPIDASAIILLVVACYTPKDPTKTTEKCQAILDNAGDRMDDTARKFFKQCGKILIEYSKGVIA